jgi:hypothetical protein
MNWEIIYYNEAVRLWVDSLPVGIRAYYARITGEMRQHGPNLGMPYTRAMGDELFENPSQRQRGHRPHILLHGFVRKDHNPAWICEEDGQDAQARTGHGPTPVERGPG